MIDWQRVGELRDEVGADDFGEIVDLFLSEVETAIAGFDGSARDAAAVEEQMHFLKGAALNLGFDALADLCRSGETAAASGDPDAVQPADVRRCFEESRVVFLQEYDQRFAA